MLREIAADVLHFLTRRDLDQACGVSKWLDALIAQCCEVYPLRVVANVSLYEWGTDFTPTVVIKDDNDDEATHHLFDSTDEAAHFTASALRSSSIETLELGDHDEYGAEDLGIMTLRPDHWTSLVDAVRYGLVRNLSFDRVNVSALDGDFLLSAASWPGIKLLGVRRSVVPRGYVSDDLLRCCAAKVPKFTLSYLTNQSDTPQVVSDDAILEFFFPAHATSGETWQNLVRECTGVTEKFLAKFLERIRSATSRVIASLAFYGAPEQRGLSAHAAYLVSGGIDEVEVGYRFPVVDDDNKWYEVGYCKRPSNTYFWVNLMGLLP